MKLIKRIFGWTMTLGLLGTAVLAVLVWQGRVPLALGKPRATAEAAAPTTKTKAQPVIAVTVAPVVGRTIQRTVQVVGTLYGQEEIDIATKVDGRVARIHHDMGDVVRPGDVLLEVDDTDFRLTVVEAKRSLELEMARLGLRELPDEDFDIHKLPAVARAELLEKNALKKLERSQTLGRRQAVSREDLDQAETDYEVAQANTLQARIEAQSSLASIRQREALFETAQQKLRDATVLVPASPAARLAAESAPDPSQTAGRKPAEVDYVIAARLVSEGEMVHGGSTTVLFRLVRDQPLKLMAKVPERYVGEVRVGQVVSLSVEAYQGDSFEGVVARVNPTVDRSNRTFEIEICVPNADRRLRPGSFTKASIETRQADSVPTIPEEALVKFAGVQKVFVVRDGAAHAVPVEPGVRLQVGHDDSTRHWLEAIGALRPDDQVVTAGHSQLAEGSQVRVRESDSPTARPAVTSRAAPIH